MEKGRDEHLFLKRLLLGSCSLNSGLATATEQRINHSHLNIYIYSVASDLQFLVQCSDNQPRFLWVDFIWLSTSCRKGFDRNRGRKTKWKSPHSFLKIHLRGKFLLLLCSLEFEVFMLAVSGSKPLEFHFIHYALYSK